MLLRQRIPAAAPHRPLVLQEHIERVMARFFFHQPVHGLPSWAPCRWRSFTHDRHRRTTAASAPRRKLSAIVMVVVDTAGDSLFGEFDSGGHRS
jgi:hypothetical protein